MTVFLLNLILALTWVALTGQFQPSNLLVGFVMSYVLLWFGRKPLRGTSYFNKVPQIIGFGGFFLWELVKANVRVAQYLLVPGELEKMQPGIVAVELDVTRDLEIVTLANMITLTPGTLSIDLSADRRILYVHSIYVDDPDEFCRQIKNGFEKRVKQVYR